MNAIDRCEKVKKENNLKYYPEFYIIENWRTQEIKLKKYPSSLWKYTLSDILKIFGRHYIKILNFHELIFFLIFNLEGWKIYNLPINRRDLLGTILGYLREETEIDGEALYMNGCPDFLLFRENGKKKEFRFVEVKASEIALSKSQIDWANKFKKYDLYIIRPAPINEKERESLLKTLKLKNHKLIEKVEEYTAMI